MNIQSGRGRRGGRRYGKVSAASSVSGALKNFFKFFLLMGFIASLFHGYTYMNQRIAETDREIQETDKIIARTEREIDELRLRREKLSSWEHIRNMNEKYKLGLVQASGGQISRIKLMPPSVAAKVSLPRAVASSAAPASARGKHTVAGNVKARRK